MTKLELEAEQIEVEFNYLQKKFLGKEMTLRNFSKKLILYKITGIDKKFDIFNPKTNPYWEATILDTLRNKIEFIANSSFINFDNYLAQRSNPYLVATAKINYLNNIVRDKLAQGIK